MVEILRRSFGVFLPPASPPLGPLGLLGLRLPRIDVDVYSTFPRPLIVFFLSFFFFCAPSWTCAASATRSSWPWRCNGVCGRRSLLRVLVPLGLLLTQAAIFPGIMLKPPNLGRAALTRTPMTWMPTELGTKLTCRQHRLGPRQRRGHGRTRKVVVAPYKKLRSCVHRRVKTIPRCSW